MKNISFFPILFALCWLIAGCDKSNCDKNVDVSAVLPNTNPSGYEVLIKTSGFSNAAKVLFGSEEADSRAGGQAGELIARVPAGLSGNVEISVEEGDCIARSGGFVVSGTLPTDVQPALSDIVIPLPLTSDPSGIGNVWINAASSFDNINNPEHTILIVEGTQVGDVINFDEAFSKENNKSVSNPVSGSANLITKQVQIVINRSSNGGDIEHFDGQFIVVPSFLPANAELAILLVSRETGRQLLIYRF